jgi:hypothetical protein
MTPFLRCYVAGWVSFCLLAIGLASRDRQIRALRANDVVRFLSTPWKLALFVPAILFTTFAGHFTDDETWDVVSGGGMSVLTVLTAWWSVGTIARVVRRAAPARHLPFAVALTLFSSSWFYDGYLLLRDGAYTARWLGNLVLSPTIYACAGLVANLELRDGRLSLAFTRSDWPRPMSPSPRAWPLLLASVPFVLVAAYFLVGFVGWRVP